MRDEDFQRFMAICKSRYENGYLGWLPGSAIGCPWREMQERAYQIVGIAFDEWLALDGQAQSYEHRWGLNG